MKFLKRIFNPAHGRDSEERYRLISQVSSDYTFSTALDSEGKMYLNWVAGAFEQMTGYTFDEYVASGGWQGHLFQDDIERDNLAFEKLTRNKSAISEVRTIRKNREIAWMRVYAHPVWDEMENRLTGIVGAVQDITERKQVEERDERRRQLLEKVIVAGKRVTESQDLQTTLKRIWHSIRYDLGFDRLGIYLHDPQNNTMNGTYGTNNQGEMANEWKDCIHLDKNTLEVKTFIDVLENEDGLHFTHQYESKHDIAANPRMSGVKDYAAVAAWAGNRPIAVLCVDNAVSQKPITNEQLEALRLFAGFSGLAIKNSQLSESLQHELAQQKRAEKNEANRRSMLEKVILLGQSVTEVKDLKTTLERIWHGVHDDIGFDRLAIFLYDQETNTIRGSLGTDNDGRIVEEWDYMRTLDHEKPTSFMRALEQPNGLFFTTDFGVEFEMPEDHEMHQVKDFAAVSAWAGDKPVAIITVDNLPSGRSFTQAQLEAVRLFAGYAGLAIQNSHLNAALQAELDQRQELIDELENKNAELERFTYTVSHDLKSPLVTITGFLGFLEMDALSGNKDRVKVSINRIAGAAKKMQNLLNDLLELSRIGRLMNTPEGVPFNEIVYEAIDHVRGNLDDVDASIEIQSELPIVHGDRIRLVEVIQNLVENSIKYLNPRTRLHIEIGAAGYNEKGCPIFFVRDNGIGIDPQYHERIFGLFNKLDVQSEGTGIGLSLVKRIIEVHNGSIWVESKTGKGATFFFTLPSSQTKE